MGHASSKERGKLADEPNRRGPISFCLVLGVLLLYPLSAGPALVAFEAGLVPRTVVEVTYAPLSWLLSVAPGSCQNAGYGYLDLWNGSIFAPLKRTPKFQPAAGPRFEWPAESL